MSNKTVFLMLAIAEGRVFALDMQTLMSIGIQLVNGIILAVVMSYLFYKPVKKFMAKRAQGIQSRMDDAEAEMTKAKAMAAEYEEKIKDIEVERNEILQIARLNATQESKVVIDEARQEALTIRQRSLDAAKADKKRLQVESRLYIIEIASRMSEQYITQTLDEEMQHKIFEDTLAKLEETKWMN